LADGNSDEVETLLRDSLSNYVHAQPTGAWLNVGSSVGRTGRIVRCTVLVWVVVAQSSCERDSTDTADPRDATCIAYFEADEHWNRQVADADKQLEGDGDEVLHSVRLFLHDASRREAYLTAYKGARSSDQDVMTTLLNADRRRCCQEFETRPRCPFSYLQTPSTG